MSSFKHREREGLAGVGNRATNTLFRRTREHRPKYEVKTGTNKNLNNRNTENQNYDFG